MSSLSSFSMVVRVDASSTVGTGHVFRCLALTDELRLKGGSATYVCAESRGNMASMLREKNYRVEMIPAGLPPAEDAAATLATLSSEGGFDFLLVDHYELDMMFESPLRAIVRAIAAVDDLANRPHDVDLLIDPSHEPEEAVIYHGLVSPNVELALGTNYILLRREFFDSPRPKREFGAVKRLLVTLGGNDPPNATGLALEALDDPAFADIQVDLTLGTSNPRQEELREKAARLSNVTMHLQSTQMAKIMADADLCIGAGGTTAWERCFMGLPSLVLVLADNQRDLAAKLDRMQCATNLGYADLLDVKTLRSALLDAIQDARWRDRIARTAMMQVDGHGVFRVLDKLAHVLERKNTEVVV